MPSTRQLTAAIRAPFMRRFNQGTPATEFLSTATATAGAATCHSSIGVVTSEALTTAAAGTYALTVTNNQVDANTLVFVQLANGTNSAGAPTVTTATAGNGSFLVIVRNNHASIQLNGTLKFQFMLVNHV
jgi:hypothetical protein